MMKDYWFDDVGKWCKMFYLGIGVWFDIKNRNVVVWCFGKKWKGKLGVVFCYYFDVKNLVLINGGLFYLCDWMF